MKSALLKPTNDSFFLKVGFRPFFLGASFYAIVSMGLWFFHYFGILEHLPSGIPAVLWHGHEMVYGFAMAVIAGFLLTAVTKWTQIQVATSRSILFLFVTWAFARLLLLAPNGNLTWVAGLSDITFNLSLLIVVGRPIRLRRQWRQIPVLVCLALILISNIAFFVSLTTIQYFMAREMNILATFIIIGLSGVIAERVIPFFLSVRIQNYEPIRNPAWMGHLGLLLILSFALAQLSQGSKFLLALIGLALAIIFAINLWSWYHPKIWSHPMTWVIYVGYGALPMGFLLYGFQAFLQIPLQAGLHGLSIGVIGILCIGMMVRVALGHSNLNVYNPPRGTALAFSTLLISACSRVLGPILLPDYYSYWIGLSQALWVGVFTWYFVSFSQILSVNPALERPTKLKTSLPLT